MYCRHCGYRLSGNPKFCPECGRDQRVVQSHADSWESTIELGDIKSDSRTKSSDNPVNRCITCGCEINGSSELCPDCRSVSHSATPQIHFNSTSGRGCLIMVVSIVVLFTAIYLFYPGNNSNDGSGDNVPEVQKPTITTTQPSNDDPDYYVFKIEIRGDDTPFSLTLGYFDERGQYRMKSVDGIAPAQYSQKAMMVSVVVQKTEELGYIQLVIYRDGKIIGHEGTSAAYGVVSIATEW